MKKKIFTALQMAGIAGQKKLSGIFRYLDEQYGSKTPWELHLIRNPIEMTAEAVKKALAENMDGFIISIPDSPNAIDQISCSEIPAVIIDVYSDALNKRDKNIVFIRNSSTEIGNAAADLFMGQGRFRSYAFLHPEETTDWSRLRFSALKKRLHDSGLWCNELFKPQEVLKIKRPAAVLAANDDAAYKLLNFLASHKISVPREIAVLGIDNDTLLCANTHPKLSSIQPDFDNEGYTAAKILDGMMKGKKHDTRIVISGIKKIVQRESTSEQSHAGRLVQKALAYIDEHALEGIGVNDVVKHLKCSRRLADLRFRELQKKSILEAITDKRLEEVCVRLANSREKIDVIATSCGYKNPNYLKNLFKSRFDMTMSEFRKNTLMYTIA